MHTSGEASREYVYRTPAGKQISFLVIGEGEVMMMALHGLSSSPHRLLEILAGVAQDLGICILVPYVPGHGGSSDCRCYDEAVELLAGWAEHAQLGQGSTIAGYSLGGVLAVALADALPPVRKELELAAPTGTQYVQARNHREVMKGLGRLLAHEVTSVVLGGQALRMAGQLGHTLGYACLQPLRFHHSLQLLRTAPDLPEIIHRLSDSSDRGIRFTRVFGRLDRAVRPSVEPLPGQELELPGVGHTFPLLPQYQGLIQMIIQAVHLGEALPSLVDAPAISVRPLAHPA
jgi:pimeloyl-ACP methyl ester carboxylesterase